MGTFSTLHLAFIIDKNVIKSSGGYYHTQHLQILMNIGVIKYNEKLLKFSQDHNINVDRNWARFIKSPIIEGDTSRL